MFALIMIVSDFRIQQYYRDKARRIPCQVPKACNEYVREQNNGDSGEPRDVHLCNGLIQSCETCNVFTVQIYPGHCGSIL